MRRKGARQRELEDARWLAAQQIDAFTPPPSISMLMLESVDVPRACPKCGAVMLLESGWTVQHQESDHDAALLICGQCGVAVSVPKMAAIAYAAKVNAHFAAKVAAMSPPRAAKAAKRSRGAA